MDKQPCLPRFVLKMNINCCKSCPKKLKKWMAKITGVNSVDVEADKKLVYVTGKIEPEKLIKKIHSELNRKATLCNSEQKSTSKDDQKIPDNNNVKNKNLRTDSSDSDDEDDESSPRCCSDKQHYSRCGRGDHKAEPYMEPLRDVVDEEICQDKHCLIHSRNPIIRNGQPFMQPPYSWRGAMPPPPPPYARGMMPPPYSMGIPPPPPYSMGMMPPPYSMGMPPSPPHPAFGYGYPRRHLPAGFDHVSDYFNDENPRGCSIM